MKFSSTRENLIKALNATVGIAVKNIQLPILNNLLIRATNGMLEFSSTNLEVAVVVRIRARIEKEGVYTFPAKTLSDAILFNNMPQFDFELKDNGECIISGGSTKIKIIGVSADDYPVIPTQEWAEKIEVDAKKLKTALEETVFATAKNEIRPELSGVFLKIDPQLGILTFAATDSFRLSEKKVNFSAKVSEKSVIVPARAIYEIIKLLSYSDEEKAQIAVTDTQIGLKYNETELVSRLIEGRYPDYTQIIPTNFKTKILLNRDEFLQQTKAAGVFATGGINAVYLNIEPDKSQITLEATHNQLGNHESSFEAEGNGESVKTALNYRYLLDGLNAVGSSADKIMLELSGTETPLVMRPDGDKTFTYIIMPIRQ